MVPLQLKPAYLPVEEVEIHPEGDLSGMVCIGKEVTEELECMYTIQTLHPPLYPL